MLALKRRWSGLVSDEVVGSELEGPQALGSDLPSPSKCLAGGKRKLSEDCATDADEDVPAPKRRFTGLSSIASSLMGISFVRSAIKLVTGANDEAEDEEEPPSPAPLDTAAADAKPAAVPAPRAARPNKPRPRKGRVQKLDVADDAPAPVGGDEEAAPTPVPVTAAATGPLFRPKRQTARYSPPVAKPVQAVSRAELKRQLRGRAPAAPARAEADIEAPAQPRAAKKTPSAASRGARLLTKAKSSTPATVRTPARRAAAAPTAPATGGAEEAQEEQAATPEVEKEAAEHQAAPVEEQVDAVVAAPVAATAEETHTQQEEPEEEAVAMQTEPTAASPISGSMMSLAHWAAAPSTDDGAASTAAGEETVAPPEPAKQAAEPETQKEEDAMEVTPEPEAEPCVAIGAAEDAEPAEPADGPGEEQDAQQEDEEVPAASPELDERDKAAVDATPAAAAAGTDGVTPASHHAQFSALPRLLPRRTASGADSGATSTSCSLLPAGLDGSAPRRRAAAAAPAPAEDGEEAEGGADGCAGEDTGRRVRFMGLEKEQEDEEAAAAEVDANDAGKQPQTRQVPTRAHLARRARMSGPKPRFGPGAFVRKGAASANTAAPPGGLFSPLTDEDADGGDAGDAGVPQTSANCDQQGSPLIRIPRTLQGGAPGMGPRQHLRDPALLSPVPGSAPAVPQMLREAFLNARLAERWRRGDAWARLDLSGIELDREGSGREAELAAVVATLTGRQGEAVVAAQLAALEPEWDHLCGVRQRYVSSPGGDGGAHAAPKSILKRASGVSPLSGAGERTPPVGSAPGGAATADANLPGFEEILAAEIVPGSLSPRDLAFATGLGLQQAGGPGTRTAGLELTPGIATRSRGIKMLASLNGNPGGGNHTPPTGQTDGARAAAVPDPAAALQQAQQLGERRARSEGSRRGGSRGHRLLQALQQAAGPAPTTAAAAARLIVDAAGGDLVTGPMATSFVN